MTTRLKGKRGDEVTRAKRGQGQAATKRMMSTRVDDQCLSMLRVHVKNAA